MVKPSSETPNPLKLPERTATLPRPALEKLATLFGAFSDATRLAILQELRDRPLSVSALVARLGTSQANISKHLKLLHRAGLLARERDGLQILYSIAAESVHVLCTFACQHLVESELRGSETDEYDGTFRSAQEEHQTAGS